MTHRLHNMMLAMLLALTTLFVGIGTLSQIPTSGGYQLFERAASGISADIRLAALENFAPSPEAASEYAIATNSPIVPGGGGLQVHEAAGGHLISWHVGKSDADLGARLNSQPNITAASSFPDRATAERAVSSALDANVANISQFLSGTGGRLVINHNVGSPVGNVMARGASTSAPSSNVRVVIQRDATMPTGYRIITGFPVP